MEGHGVESDAHAGPFVRHRYLARRQPRLPNLRQVHLIPAELFASLSEAGFKVAAGDLGENITTTGLDLERMTPCVLIDRFQAGLKRQVFSSAETGPPFKCGVLGIARSAEGHSRRSVSVVVVQYHLDRPTGSLCADAVGALTEEIAGKQPLAVLTDRRLPTAAPSHPAQPAATRLGRGVR